MDAETLTRGDALDAGIARATAALASHRQADGHWRFPLEADATIPAEYVLLLHFLDRPDPALEGAIGVYLRGIQRADGGWPLFHGGAADLSATVKAYFALKMIGDDAAAPHMRRARETVLRLGGAERSNVFTRVQLALYGEVPWRAVPSMPVEIVLLPQWFFFHLSKVSYWSRTVIVPLLVLMTMKPRARNPRGVHVPELFRQPPAAIRDWLRGPYRSVWGHLFRVLDSVLKLVEPRFPARRRARALAAAEAWVRARLNGGNGLGAIYPAMANTVMMFDTLGYCSTDPDVALAWEAVERLVVREPDRAWVQPCVSPVWDTGLAGHAMAEARRDDAAAAAARWLLPHQIRDVAGDWSVRRPGVPAGGWAFQYANPHYPDVDDTAVVGMLLHRAGGAAFEPAIERARLWILGMQSRDGGWGAFEPENTHDYLNHIPFADHGALLDPPTADVTARCLGFLAQIGMSPEDPALRRAAQFLRRHQEADGSWFGRWGTNYIYGTWSALVGLAAAGVPADDPAMARGADWLLRVQRDDGGWGEAEDTYAGAPRGCFDESTPSQTAWALLGLMAAGRVDDPAVGRGMAWLAAAQRDDGEWREAPYTAVGFPRVFYLRYHGYRLYFPLLAMARYRNLVRSNVRGTGWGF